MVKRHRLETGWSLFGHASSNLALSAKLTVVNDVVLFTDVAELVDALDLGSSVFGREGSTPSIGTKLIKIYSDLLGECGY